MEERPAAAGPRPAPPEGAGYPLRDEATEPFPPPSPGREEFYAVAPVAPGAPRRRFVPAGNPWPWLIAIILLLVGLGAAYGVTRSGSAHNATAPPPAPARAPAPAPITTTTAQTRPPPPVLLSVPDVTGIQGLQAVHTLQADHLVASLRYVPSTQPARRVISQWPIAGTKVHGGTSVLLNLSQGNKPKAGPTGYSSG